MGRYFFQVSTPAFISAARPHPYTLSSGVCHTPFTDLSSPGRGNPILPVLRPKPQNSSSFLCHRASLSRSVTSQPSKCPELDHPWPAPPQVCAPSPRADVTTPVAGLPGSHHVSARAGVLIAAAALWLPLLPPSLSLRHMSLCTAFRATQKLLPL